MKWFHITPRRNVEKILKEGLRLECCQADLWPRIWFYTLRRVGEAMEKMADRKMCRIDQLAILEVEINRLDVRYEEGGCCYTDGPIAAHNIRLYYDVKYLSCR